MNQSAINEYWGSVVARYRAGPLPGFLRWWRGELADMVPAGLRRRMVPPRPVLWLVPSADTREVSIWTGGATPEHRDTFGAGEDAGLLRDRWQALIDGFDDGQPEVRLCLPGQDVLQCDVELPLAVEANLSDSLRYQLDQVTPFSADQVYFDYAIAERDAEHGRLKVDLRLAMRGRVDDLRERLAAAGIRPHAVDCQDGSPDSPRGAGFNMLPLEQRPRHVYRRARINWLMAAGLVLVLAVVMAESLYLHGRTVERLSSEVNELRSEADDVMALQRELEDALAAANFLAERRRRQPVAIRVIDEVTRILPTDMWISQFRMQGNELMLQGQADQAQRLIEIINDSGLLGDAEFQGPVSIDPSSGRERFRARANIETTTGGERAVAAGSGE